MSIPVISDLNLVAANLTPIPSGQPNRICPIVSPINLHSPGFMPIGNGAALGGKSLIASGNLTATSGVQSFAFPAGTEYQQAFIAVESLSSCVPVSEIVIDQLLSPTGQQYSQVGVGFLKGADDFIKVWAFNAGGTLGFYGQINSGGTSHFFGSGTDPVYTSGFPNGSELKTATSWAGWKLTGTIAYNWFTLIATSPATGQQYIVHQFDISPYIDINVPGEKSNWFPCYYVDSYNTSGNVNTIRVKGFQHGIFGTLGFRETFPIRVKSVTNPARNGAPLLKVDPNDGLIYVYYTSDAPVPSGEYDASLAVKWCQWAVVRAKLSDLQSGVTPVYEFVRFLYANRPTHANFATDLTYLPNQANPKRVYLDQDGRVWLDADTNTFHVVAHTWGEAYTVNNVTSIYTTTNTDLTTKGVSELTGWRYLDAARVQSNGCYDVDVYYDATAGLYRKIDSVLQTAAIAPPFTTRYTTSADLVTWTLVSLGSFSGTPREGSSWAKVGGVWYAIASLSPDGPPAAQPFISYNDPTNLATTPTTSIPGNSLNTERPSPHLNIIGLPNGTGGTFYSSYSFDSNRFTTAKNVSMPWGLGNLIGYKTTVQSTAAEHDWGITDGPAALVAPTLSGPASTTKSRLNGFTFTAATGGTAPYEYQGQRKKTADATWVDVSDSFASPFDVKSLLSSTEYQVRVRVTDDVGDIAYSNTITATTAAAPTPTPGTGGDMASFSGTPLYYEPVTFDADLGGPGCMYGLRVAAAGTVVARQRDGEDMPFVLTAPGNIQGDFTSVRSDGTDVDEEDITVARR